MSVAIPAKFVAAQLLELRILSGKNEGQPKMVKVTKMGNIRKNGSQVGTGKIAGSPVPVKLTVHPGREWDGTALVEVAAGARKFDASIRPIGSFT